MKIVVLNNIGNVGKSTSCKYMLYPRLFDCEVLRVETLKSDGESTGEKLSASEFDSIFEKILGSIILLLMSAHLSESELGQLSREAYIKNPKNKIDWQSDMVKNAQTIQENAEGITAGSAEQCSKKSISHSSFKEHVCERSKSIVTTCTNTASVPV